MRFIPLLRMALNLKHKLFIPRIFYFISLTSTENAERESVAKGDCICHQLCACLCMCTQTCVCDICLLASYTSPGTKILVPPLGKSLPGKCCCRSPWKLEDQDTGRQPVRGPGPKARADVETRRPGSRTVGTVEGAAWGADPEGARCEGRRLPSGPEGPAGRLRRPGRGRRVGGYFVFSVGLQTPVCGFAGVAPLPHACFLSTRVHFHGPHLRGPAAGGVCDLTVRRAQHPRDSESTPA